MSELFIGLMSGTSLDGVDGVLVNFSGGHVHVQAHAGEAFPDALRAELLGLNSSGPNELHRAALAGNALAQVYAQVVRKLLSVAQIEPQAIQAIGVHGQTVRHQPQAFDGQGYTLQLNNPALLAELCGIDVVADFRSRDVAAGGQGAPLVPAFHKAVFGKTSQAVAVLNLGGIANLSFVDSITTTSQVTGFDCGPGNVLLDLWCQRHTGQSFDRDGAWAATGQVIEPLLLQMLGEPFFAKAPPKSTGRDLFHARWLDQHLQAYANAKPPDVQATLVELTVSPVNDCVASYKNHSKSRLEQLLVCGGGALNGYLMRRLQARLGDVRVVSTSVCGIDPQQVEAAAFAWLARQFALRSPGNLASVTGAAGPRVLGALYPAR